MVRFTGGLLLFSAIASAIPTDRIQSPLTNYAKKPHTPARKLNGKFLHITDFHPDPFYKPYSSPDSDNACHSGHGPAGVLGAEATSCDSPIALVNATFQWINDNIKDDVDFVIWTGDSARHDNDERYPRSDRQVISLNELLVSKFVEVFGKEDNVDDPDPTNDFVVPIIPTFGNNDILPHNIFAPGPNRWTKKYASIWNGFVPEEQKHSFARGGWFFVEVIQNKLAVFSLNTIYFFDSNSAVDGCDQKSEPGYEQMNWLRIQLEMLRKRGMKAIITGHVPPAHTKSKQSWDETCWQKYTLWMRQYRDVVVGSVYGHANIDHFTIQDARDLKYKFLANSDSEQALASESNNPFSINSKSDYLKEMRKNWSKLPKPPVGLSYAVSGEDDAEERVSIGRKKSKKSKKQRKQEKFLKNIGGEWAERFSLSLVSPSVVPNFFPTLRIVEYNISGLEDYQSGVYPSVPAISDADILGELDEGVEIWDDDDVFSEFDDHDVVHDLTRKKKKKKKGKKGKSKKPYFVIPKPPSSTAPPGPAYSAQTLTWLSYAQYYANITRINEEAAKNDLTHEEYQEHNRIDQASRKSPAPQIEYEIEYDTKHDKVYHLQDMTVRNYLDLAERMGRKALKTSSADTEDAEDTEEEDVATLKAKNKAWHAFVKRAYVLTKPEQELQDDFG